MAALFECRGRQPSDDIERRGIARGKARDSEHVQVRCSNLPPYGAGISVGTSFRRRVRVRENVSLEQTQETFPSWVRSSGTIPRLSAWGAVVFARGIVDHGS